MNAQSKLASLRSQLADATEQYNDDKQNHYFDLMSQGYSKMADDANKAIDDIEDAVRRSTEKQSEIIREMLGLAGNEYKNVYTTINGILTENGIVLSDITQKSIADFGTEKESITNVGLTYSEMTSQMKTDSEAITGAEGILTTAINKLGMIGGENGKLNEIVKKAGEVKTGFTNIGTEIENITKKFNEASTSIVKTASESLAQIKKLTDEVNAKVNGASNTGNKKTTPAGAETKQTSSSLKGKDTSSKNIKDATTVVATGKNAKDTTAKKTTAKKTYTTSEAKEYAIAYIMQNSQKIAASLIKKAKYKMSKDIASMNGNKTLTDKQVEYLVNHVNSMLGRSGKNAFTSAQIFSAIKDNLKKAISGKGYSVTSFASVLKKYAKGSENIDKQQLAITNESGWEAIYRKSDGAILTPLNVGDKVFTNEMSENLWKLAQGNNFGAETISKASSPVVTNVETYKPNITVSFENFMTVQGNVDKDVLGDLKSLKNEWMTDFSKHLTKEFGLLGNKRRFS